MFSWIFRAQASAYWMSSALGSVRPNSLPRRAVLDEGASLDGGRAAVEAASRRAASSSSCRPIARQPRFPSCLLLLCGLDPRGLLPGCCLSRGLLGASCRASRRAASCAAASCRAAPDVRPPAGCLAAGLLQPRGLDSCSFRGCSRGLLALRPPAGPLPVARPPASASSRAALVLCRCSLLRVPPPAARPPGVQPPAARPRPAASFLTGDSPAAQPLAVPLPVARPPGARPPAARSRSVPPPAAPPAVVPPAPNDRAWQVQRLAPAPPGRFAPARHRRHLEAPASRSPDSRRLALRRSRALAPMERQARPTWPRRTAPWRSRPAQGSVRAPRHRTLRRASGAFAGAAPVAASGSLALASAVGLARAVGAWPWARSLLPSGPGSAQGTRMVSGPAHRQQAARSMRCNGSLTDVPAGSAAVTCAGTSTTRRSGASIRRSRQGKPKPGSPSPWPPKVRLNSSV